MADNDDPQVEYAAYAEATQTVPVPFAPNRPAVLTAADVLPAVRDGLIALSAAYVTALIAIVLVIAVGLHSQHVNVSFGDYLTTSAWFTASSLGTPISGSISESVNVGGSGSSSDSLVTGVAVNLSLRITIWLLTAVILYLVYRAVRGRERRTPSGSLGQVVARAALPAVVVSVTLLILAFATRSSNPFGGASYLSSTAAAYGGQSVSGSMGIDAPFVFLGPLLLVFAAALLGRLGVWIHSMSADPRAIRMRMQLSQWTPSIRVAWLQTRVIGALVGIGLWMYAVFEVVSKHELSHGGLAILIGGLFLLPNFAIYGILIGFGVTLYGTASSLTEVVNLSTGATSPGAGSYDLGLFASHRPWGLWLLLLAVLIGTVAPAILARRGARFAANRDDFLPNGAWRSVLLGIGAALLVTLLGALELTTGVDIAGPGSYSDTESFGPSLLAAIGLTALWFLLSYMAFSLSLGHRLQAQTTTIQQPYVPTELVPTEPIYELPTIHSTLPFTQPIPARGFRPKLVIPLVALVVLAIGGYFTYQHFVGDKPSGAQGAVSSYFQDIEAGNASAAAALATGPYQDTLVVGPATIANAANRPSAFTIVSSEAVPSSFVSQYRQSGVTGTNLTYVAVKYAVHASELTDTYLAEQDAKTSKWELVDPYRELSVSGGSSNSLTVDGESFSQGGAIEVFPGAHVVAEPNSPDFSAVSTTAYPVEGTTTYQNYTWTTFSEVTLPAPTLSAQGQSAAQAAYSAALDQCATTAESGYGPCGIDDTYNYYTCNNVTWTITTVGTVVVDLSTQNGDGSYDFTATGSVASESGDYTDDSGNDQTFSGQTTNLEDSTGSITFNSDGSASASLTG